jgi:class 3 adenylate cyclase
MSLNPWVKAAMAVLLPVWIFVLGLNLVQFARGQVSFVYLTAQSDSPTSYPQVGVVRVAEVAEQSGLQAGDLLLRAGDTDLRGAGPFSSHAMILAEARDHQVPIVYQRQGEQIETVLDVSLRPAGRRYVNVFVSIVSGLFALLLILRAPGDPRTPALLFWYISFAIMHAPFQGQSPALTYASMALYFTTHIVILPLAVVIALKFAERKVTRLAYAGLWVLALAGPGRAAQYNGAFMSSELGQQLFSATNVATALVFLGIFAVTMFRADKLNRRQLSWILLGIYLGITPVAALEFAVVFKPELYALREVAPALMMTIPLGFLIAIVRYDLLDIHRIISATAAYTLLGVALLSGLLAVVPRAAAAATEAVGIPTETAQILLSLALAGILVPSYRVLGPQIDRIFFKERGIIKRGIDRLLYDMSGCAEPEAVGQLVGRQLDALLAPDVCAIYARSEGVYAPVFTRGSAVPPALAGEGPLIDKLEEMRKPVNVDRWRRRSGSAELGPADTAFLDTLGASVFIPVHHRGTLAIIICLGTKRSGDIYTASELALMGRVADRIATEFGRFDDAEIIRQSREMQDSLRHYVPGAIADRLSSGKSLEAGEREVSVLFVDIRGYTALSQGLAPDEIFSTVNQYTEAVSRVVRGHGGSVVEFNGDGMMVVFGAPEALEAKERAAVEAGREITSAVAALAPAAPVAGREHLSCGVGIATGPAFVGNIQAVDRMIWSAIGNTTNLAARLEALTRDLDADMVIDETTWQRLDGGRDDFEKRGGMSIRGRSEQQDIYLLPVKSAPPRRLVSD